MRSTRLWVLLVVLLGSGRLFAQPAGGGLQKVVHGPEITGAGTTPSPLGITPCSNGQGLEYNGTAWVCNAYGTGNVTTVGGTAGTLPVWSTTTALGNYAGSTATACGAGNATTNVAIGANGVLTNTCSSLATLGAAAGTGTLNKLPKWSNTTGGLVDSSLLDNGTTVSTTDDININKTVATSWLLTTRSTPNTFPVSVMQPTQANTVLAYDLMPKGTPTIGTGGYTWMDVCDADLIANSAAPTHCARVGMGGTANFDSIALNGAAQANLTLSINGTAVETVASNAVTFAQGVAINPTSGTALAITENQNAGTFSTVTNTNAGTAAFSKMGLSNDGSTGVMEMYDFGTGYTTNGGLMQDSGVLYSGAGLSNGMSIIAGATTGAIRFYTGGLAAGNLAASFDATTHALDLNSHKITGLANGTVSTDAAAFGQIGSAVNAAVSGTTNTLAMFTGTNTIGNSPLTYNGTDTISGPRVYAVSSSAANPTLQVTQGGATPSNWYMYSAIGSTTFVLGNDNAGTTAMQVTYAGDVTLPHTETVSGKLNGDTVTATNTAQNTADVAIVTVNQTGLFGDFSSIGLTHNSYGINVTNSSDRWASGVASETNHINSYGIKSVVTTPLNNGTNYGIYLDATGNTTNYALYANNGANYLGGNTTIGATTAAAHAINGTVTFNGGAGTNGQILEVVGGLPSWTSAASSGLASGTGTLNVLPKWSNTTGGLTDSLVVDDGTTFKINTNKFTVTEANGNTAIAGTLNVTSTTTTAKLNATGAAGQSTVVGSFVSGGQTSAVGAGSFANTGTYATTTVAQTGFAIHATTTASINTGTNGLTNYAVWASATTNNALVTNIAGDFTATNTLGTAIALQTEDGAVNLAATSGNVTIGNAAGSTTIASSLTSIAGANTFGETEYNMQTASNGSGTLTDVSFNRTSRGVWWTWTGAGVLDGIGFVTGTPTDGQRFMICVLGGGSLQLTHESTSETTAGRRFNFGPVNVTPIVRTGQCRDLIYDNATQRWKMEMWVSNGSGLSSGSIPKGTGNNEIGNSSLTDGGTNVTGTEPLLLTQSLAGQSVNLTGLSDTMSDTYNTSTGVKTATAVQGIATPIVGSGTNTLTARAGYFSATGTTNVANLGIEVNASGGAVNNIAILTDGGDNFFNTTSGVSYFERGVSGVNGFGNTAPTSAPTNQHLEWNEDWLMGGQGISATNFPLGTVWSWNASGGGAAVLVDVSSTTSIAGRPGVAQIFTNTPGGIGTILTSPIAVSFADGNWEHADTVMIPTASVKDSNEIVITDGFTDATTTFQPVDGCFFAYDVGNRLTGGNNASFLQDWEVFCIANSTATAYILNGQTEAVGDGSFVTVASSMTAGNWYRLEVDMTGTSQADFYINGTKVAQIKTNIPSTNARATGAGISYKRQAGSISNYVVDLDQTHLAVDLTAARNP